MTQERDQKWHQKRDFSSKLEHDAYQSGEVPNWDARLTSLVAIATYTLPIRHVTSSSAIDLLSACAICWIDGKGLRLAREFSHPFGCWILKIGCVEPAHATAQNCFSNEEFVCVYAVLCVTTRFILAGVCLIEAPNTLQFAPVCSVSWQPS